MRLDELQDVLMLEQRRVWQGRQKRQNLAPPLQGPTGEFADHEGMSPHFATAQAIRQEVIASTEVIDPDRGVDEH